MDLPSTVRWNQVPFGLLEGVRFGKITLHSNQPSSVSLMLVMLIEPRPCCHASVSDSKFILLMKLSLYVAAPSDQENINSLYKAKIKKQ